MGIHLRDDGAHSEAEYAGTLHEDVRVILKQLKAVTSGEQTATRAWWSHSQTDYLPPSDCSANNYSCV